MKDPKIGERCAYYHVGDHADGRMTGEITSFVPPGSVWVRLDKPWNHDVTAHPKQLRRLKKKEKPERWTMEEIRRAWNAEWIATGGPPTSFDAGCGVADRIQNRLLKIAEARK